MNDNTLAKNTTESTITGLWYYEGALTLDLNPNNTGQLYEYDFYGYESSYDITWYMRDGEYSIYKKGYRVMLLKYNEISDQLLDITNSMLPSFIYTRKRINDEDND